MRIRLQPLPLMTLFSVAAFALLIMLGAWQWGRYQEKRLLNAHLPDSIVLSPFTPLPDARQLVFGARDGKPGWRVFEPVRYGERVVFVDADWIPGAEIPDMAARPAPGVMAEAREVSGVAVHPRAPGRFAAPGDPTRRIWYAVDLPKMAAAAGLEGVEPWYVAIPYVGATGRAEPNPFAQPRDPLPPERHLGYAITWWGLAGALVGVYLAFHARQGRFKITR